MEIVTKPLAQESAVALGVFDGVHLGHRRVLAAAASCKEQGLLPCAFTFDTATLPTKHGQPFEYLYTQKHKLVLLETCGIEAVYQPAFSQVQEMDGETFCREILGKILCAKKVFCGGDFRFGKGAAWGFDDLCRFGSEVGFSVYKIGPVYESDKKVSSTLIRSYLKAGDPLYAGCLLDRFYTITGEVCHGLALGRTISFPTINQPFAERQLVPKHGVYLSRCHTPLGAFWGVTNIGVKPTVSEEKIPLAETHLLDFEGDLYGAECSTELVAYLRPEKKFQNINALRRAIERDIEKARVLAKVLSSK